MAKVAIIGGGITGLAAAYYLEKKGVSDIVLFEAADRLGGKVQTIKEDGFLVEAGPDSFIVAKPQAVELAKEVGLESEIIDPKTSNFYFLHKEKGLIRGPKGLMMMAPVDEEAFLKDDFFTEEGKKRILEEQNIPPKTDNEDESFKSFIERRFGAEMYERYAEPLFAGIYSTEGDALSLQATFPMLKMMEQKHGSLTAAMRSMPKSEGQQRSPFVSLRGGIQQLTDAIVQHLKHTEIRLNTPVNQIKSEAGGVSIILVNGETVKADKVICTTLPFITYRLLAEELPQVSDYLADYKVSSSLIVTLAYKEENINKDFHSTGFLLSGQAGELTLNAGTWSSEKWEGRAPEGYFLARCFMNANEVDPVKKAHEAMAKLLDIQGSPERYWLHDWSNLLPQYKVGHLQRLEELRKALPDSIILAGAAYEGVGLPDCIKQAREVVEQML